MKVLQMGMFATKSTFFWGGNQQVIMGSIVDVLVRFGSKVYKSSSPWRPSNNMPCTRLASYIEFDVLHIYQT